METRLLASILVGLLSTSCGTLREARPPSTGEIIFLPRAPRVGASLVVEKVELRRAVEELLPYVSMEATRSELTRLVADSRFHGRRPEALRVVLAGWGSGPTTLDEITKGYRSWCTHSGQPECLSRQLTDSDVYQVAFDFALGAEWDGFVGEVKSTIDPSTIRLVLLTGLVIFMASIAFPELTSKIPAAIATAVLTAYLGARAVCDLIFGWIQMVSELDAATTFEQVRAAGQRYGEKVGAQTARILILLATAAIAEGGLVARLMKLPRAAQASAALATETGGVRLEVVGQVKNVRVVPSGVAISVEGVGRGAIGVAMAAHGSQPAPEDPASKNGWKLDPAKDLDWRGTGRTVEDGLAEAFRRTGIPREEFEVTKWARTAEGKSFPVEWRAPGGAEVNIDTGHARYGPGVPHVGYQTPGKGGSVGHILLDVVRANR
ncbi:MAG TPA: polymorphic toxin type 47 domain-containing protein [Myxococcaceae bacterium]|nr:polymorphic toxin type 47 domain-containing protein [Myxococcaceae bacterium]